MHLSHKTCIASNVIPTLTMISITVWQYLNGVFGAVVHFKGLFFNPHDEIENVYYSQSKDP